MVDPRVEVEIARRYLVNGWQSFKYMPGDSWGTDRHTIPQGQNGGDRSTAKTWHSLPARILTASPHLQGGDIPWDKVQELREQGMGLVEALDALGV